MFTFGYTWRPWKSDIALADGPLIREYIDTVAGEYDVDRLIRYEHRITSADWDSDQERWTVTATVGDPAAGETVTMTAGFLWSCAGYYQYEQGFQPAWPGMASSAVRSSTRSTGRRTSTTPASAWSSSAAVRPP